MSEPICITAEMAAEEMMVLFQSGHLIRVPVVDKENRLTGMVTRRDLLAGYLESALGPLPYFRRSRIGKEMRDVPAERLSSAIEWRNQPWKR